jgi:CRISPR/Cas system-associated exonuclease Cas4 (RecB family)
MMMTAYLSSLAATRVGYVALVIAGLCLAIAAWLTVPVDLAVCTTLPPVYGLFLAYAKRAS